MLASTKKKLWHELTYTISIVKEVALSLRKLHEQMVVPIERDEFVQSEITRKVGIFIECYSPTDREIHALYELISQYSSHDAGYKTLIQGDFWHGNIIRSATHDSLIIVDWQYARWATDVSLDVYLFLLAGAVALVRGTDEERARAAAGVIEQWSANIIPVYLEAYGKASRFSLLPLKYGMILCCVDKAVRAVMDFGYNQDDDGIWRNLFTELVNLKEWALED